MPILMIHDETASGTVINQLCLELDSSSITVEELLKKRIGQELQSHNGQAATHGVFQLQPGGSHAALRSFRDHGFIIFINKKRVEKLSQEIEVSPNTRVRFVQAR